MTKYILRHSATPKSLNAGGTGSRRHWSVGHAEKKLWEGIYQGLLMEAKVPRGMASVVVAPILYFRTKHRRDAENYRSSISKPLADALVYGGWLPDDTAEFFTMRDLILVGGEAALKNGLTEIVLYPEYEVSACGRIRLGWEP